MSFFLGLVIGIVAGIALIVGFVRSENSRSKRRSQLATTIAAFARMTVEDSRKLLAPEYYPSWVVFSQRQKLTWLNLHLTKIWPYVDEAASELIKTSVEPVLEQYRPVILSSLKFSKFTLGTVAPQFTGISIIEDGGDGITMELEMNWDGNPSIILDIKTRFGVALPVQVKDIGFTGIFRLIFKPLVDEFPCFGAVCYSLRQKKKMDFKLKVIGGDIKTIPGLSDAIEGTIRDAIEDSITWPVRKIVPILPGDYSDLELKPVGVLEVKLVQAKELTNKDIIGKSDPFAVLYIRPLPDRMKTSKTIDNQLNPVWNEHFQFVVEDSSTQHLVVKVYDHEGIQAAELIGCAQIRLNELEPGKVKDVWLKLVKDLEVQRDNKNRGETTLDRRPSLSLSVRFLLCISVFLSPSAIWVQTFVIGVKMYGGGTQNSLRKALGAIKDSTTVSLAKVNSDYKELDIAIVKATNHVERPAKEKYIRAIFAAISATRPRADVAYCIHALSRRLSKTHNWAVALKTLIVIHRALREVDPTFHEELINYGRSRNHRNHMLNMAHFKDDSSPNAWDYSAWVRTYALFLEERLECFSVLKYDVESERPRTKDLDTPELLEQLPALQQLLFRVLGCQPQGAAVHNFVIQLALSMVASESIKIYNAISDGVVNLVDKFFEMQRHDALKALDIYQRSGKQAERLSEFYEICKGLDIGRGETFTKIEQPPASFVQAMEEYVREAPRASTVRKDRGAEDKNATSKTILAIEYKKTSEVQEARPPSPPQPKPEPEPEPVKVEAPVVEPPDLLGLNDPVPGASELDEKNALALAIVPIIDQSTPAAPTPANGTTGWELALVTAPSSNESATTSTKLGGGLDKLMLDSLYDDAIRRSNQNVSYNPWEPTPMANPMMLQTAHDPFFSSNLVAAPHSVQMAAMANQQQAFMYQQQQQQQQMMMMMMSPQQQQPLNPYSNPYGASIQQPYGSGIPVPAYNPYTGLM